MKGKEEGGNETIADWLSTEEDRIMKEIMEKDTKIDGYSFRLGWESLRHLIYLFYKESNDLGKITKKELKRGGTE